MSFGHCDSVAIFIDSGNAGGGGRCERLGGLVYFVDYKKRILYSLVLLNRFLYLVDHVFSEFLERILDFCPVQSKMTAWYHGKLADVGIFPTEEGVFAYFNTLFQPPPHLEGALEFPGMRV